MTNAMRITNTTGIATLLAAVMVLGVVALAQGAGAGAGKETIAKTLIEEATAGPGYIQEDFVNSVGTGLTEQFGEKRADQMLESLGNRDLSEKDVLRLMNGTTTKSGLQDMFGASRSELSRLEKVLDGAVDDKNRKMFVGVMVVVMVVEFDVDPGSDFCKQACGARDEMDSDSFQKMLKGNVSSSTIQDAFGMSDKGDCKFMQEILNQMMQSMFFQHPMAQSMGMNRGKPLSKEDMSQFGELSEGMAGFPGADSPFAEGTAGGMPFDMEMPPCPFAAGNFKSMFGETEGEGEDGGEGGKPAKKKKEEKKK